MTEYIADIIGVFSVAVLLAAIVVINKEHKRSERRWIERVCIGGPM